MRRRLGTYGRRAIAITGGAAFSPLDLSPVLWLAASAITGLADGAAVTTWADGSGNGNNATQATADNKPTYQTAEINGHPVVRFDGTNDLLATGSFTLAQPVHVFLVGKMSGGAVDYRYFLDGLAGNDRMSLYYIVAGDTVAIYTATSAAELTVAANTTSYFVWTALFSGASSRLRKNGAADATGELAAATAGGVTIGTRRDGQYPGGADIAEVIVYASVLSDANRDRVEAYLAAKYNL